MIRCFNDALGSESNRFTVQRNDYPLIEDTVNQSLRQPSKTTWPDSVGWGSKCLRPISGKSQVTCDLAIFTLMLTKNYSMSRKQNKLSQFALPYCAGISWFLAELNQCWNQQKTNLQKYPQTIVMEPNHNIEQHISGNVRHSLFAMWAMINTTALSHEILVDQ